MKTLSFFFIVLTFPSFLFAQELTGFWTGTLKNDTTKREQHYELALSEYKGKVTGYSYTTFISNDTFYYSVKRMKATRKDSIWIVEDDYMVVNNFPERAAKGVRQINTFRLNKNDSTWHMDGTWKTTQTKRYYSLTGTMEMREEPDISKSTLVAHLEELNLQNNVVFYQDKKESEPMIVKLHDRSKAALVKNAPKKQDQPLVNNSGSPIQKQITAEPEQKKLVALIPEDKKTDQPQKPIIKEEPAKSIVVNTEPQTHNTTPTVQKKPEANTSSLASVNQKPIEQKKEQPIITPKKEPVIQPVIATVQKPKEEVVVKPKEQIAKTTVPVEQKNTVTNPAPAKTNEVIKTQALPTAVATRKSETIQQIYFTTDSLIIALYDNGVVDGDTVSVFLNGQNILDRQKLKEAATKKTIYIPPSADSMQLVLFAENLGTIPPNTGLMTIRDGQNSYQVRFSADMQKNAAIVFRRKQTP